MDKYRILVYEDKTSLDAFEVNKTGTLNSLIYDEWLLGRTEIDSFEVNAKPFYLKVFNDAYYLCTLALMLPIGKELLPKVLKDKVAIPSVIFPLVYTYLSMLAIPNRGIKRFFADMDKKYKIDNGWKQNYTELQDAISGYNGNIDPKIFAQRELTPDLLSSVNWFLLTNHFNKKTIEQLVTNYARNNHNWQLMVEAIKAAAEKYDYDYGFEEIEQEGFDEDGPYVQKIKVPIYPYDSYGNEILEPLKSAGVYDFCDKLKERYEELALPLITDIDTATAPVQETALESTDINDSCFKLVNEFVKDRVKDALGECGKKKANLALLEVTLYDHGQLNERNAHLPFLRELVDWGLLPDISNAENPENELKKTANSVRDKARKLPSEGYLAWNDHPNDKFMCEKIGRQLGDTMPYNR